MSSAPEKSGLELVEHYLKTGELVDRWDAAAELVRILALREGEYTRLVRENVLTQAEVDLRNARLACAYAYTVDPALQLTGPHRYRDDLERAIWLAEARGYVPAHSLKGGRR